MSLTIRIGALALLAVGTTIGAAQERFMPVAEGILDTETGLVWGFSMYSTGEYLRDVGIHVNGGTGYTWNGANTLGLNCYDENGEELPDGFCTYPEFSAWYAGVSRDDWRLPTKDELVEAAQAGLSLDWDASPHAGMQFWDAGRWHWTSTTGKKKRGGFDGAWAVSIYTGETWYITQGSVVNLVLVRGVPAPEEDPKPGKGNGKK